MSAFLLAGLLPSSFAAETRSSNPLVDEVTVKNNKAAAINQATEAADEFSFPDFRSCRLAPEPISANTTFANPFSEPSLQNPIRAWSDEGYTENNKAYLSGNVQIRQDDQLIKADRLVADNTTKSYHTEGELLFASPDIIVEADRLAYQEANGSSQIDNSRFYLYSNNGNGTAESITISDKQLLTLYNSDFSTCPQDQRSWAFESDKIVIDKESGWGEAYGSVVRVADIPVFYLPYITFPIDDRRKTGLLPPAFSNSDRNGVDISAPYYLNLAPNYDLTLSPRYMSKRGTGLDSEFRYLLPTYDGELSFSYLPDDDLADKNPEISDNRWAYSVKHHNQFSESWSAGIDAQKVSDDAYFQDFGGGVTSSNETNLSQQLYLQYLTENWNFKTQYRDWQLLNTSSHRYKIAPRIEATRYFQGQNYYAQIYGQATRFEQDAATQIEDANRYHLEPTVGWNLESLYGFIRPKLSVALTHYRQTEVSGEKQSFDRTLPTFSLDTGLFLEKPLQIGKNSYTQTLEPRLFYLYTPFEDQTGIGVFDTSVPTFNFTELFSRNRFAGIDRIGDSNQISASLTSRFIDQSGQERVSVTLGGVGYFEDRKVTLNDGQAAETIGRSGILAKVNWRWTDDLEIKGGIEWDDREERTQRGLLMLSYQPKPNHILNLGHRVRRNFDRQLEDIELAAAWPISENWRILGRYSRDLAENRTNESFFGLEYESCCWAVRVVSRRYLNIQLDSQGDLLASQGDLHNSGVFVQFVLKGIGSLRGSTTQFLEESIYGYQDRLGQ
ncbi:LPS-assembly protein LptD [Kangiella sp. TOML190]|uniref:LPS-assembly protein LptD n=1 Tax=Kangiella sp. TOML190 TaxID=2931351 RepID=UPI00203F01A9|nr:LPS assembly protein LptD [Kangiella sp. TOML190]